MSDDAKATEEVKSLEDIGDYKYGFHDRDDNYVFKSERGLSREVVENISRMKAEPAWMLEFRLKALEHYRARPMPNWGPDISNLDLENIFYYVKPTEKSEKSWDNVPDDIKNTFDKLGIPEAEQKFLAGVGAQYECLSGDTGVYTARGVVPIRDVTVGDTVFSLDEETNEIIPAPVKAFMPKGERLVYEVKVGTRKIKATEKHPFLVLELHRAEGKQRGRYARSWKYLSDIKVGDLVAVANKLPDVESVRESALADFHELRQGFSPTVMERKSSSRSTASRLLEIAAQNNEPYFDVENLAFGNHVNEFFGYARVESITSTGVEMVYDIEVDGPHNFVAEGLIVHNSEMVYHSILEHLEKQGVIFLSIEDGLKKHPELFREYFGTVIPIEDNKFAALNSAVWSGGSFVYVPKGVKVDLPLQAYFRLNTANVGQFERTLIIVDEGASVHYVEGCFLAGAQVRTRNGEKPIEEIEVGDEVMTHQGRYRRVYNTMKRPYHGDIYNINFFGDSKRELQVTEEHPLLVVRRQRDGMRNTEFTPEWTPASAVREGDYLVVPVPHPVMETEMAGVAVPLGRGRHAPVERYVEFPQEKDFYRLLGYYFSEGHVDNEHYLSLSFHVDETALIADATELIEKYFGKSPIANRPRQNGQTLVLSSTETARAFAYEFGSNVYEKHIPEWTLNAPLELLSELIRGMWQGDGSYDARKNMFRFNSVSQNLAYSFRDSLLRLGVSASVNIQERMFPRKDMYTVIISSPFNSRFGEIVGMDAPDGHSSGSPFHLDENFLYVPIRQIAKDEQETMVYNFSVEEDESYVAEGVISHNCTAPQYTTNSFHSGVIEIIVKKGARSRYSTIQNWSKNVFNLVTQRAKVFENATHEWVDSNIGSLLTMKYPSCYLMESGAHGEMLSMAFASAGQIQDAGSKMVHFAPNTTSKITSKSISKNGGRASYRGLVKVHKGAKGVKSNVVCDALLLDPQSRSDTYPTIEIDEDDVSIGHEASVSKVGEDQLFYLMSRGLTEEEATGMVVAGFIEPLVKELPMEYAVEMNRLIQLQMEGSIG